MSGPQGPFFCQNFTFDNEKHLHLSPTCATLKAKPILTKSVRISKELTRCLSR